MRLLLPYSLWGTIPDKDLLSQTHFVICLPNCELLVSRNMHAHSLGSLHGPATSLPCKTILPAFPHWSMTARLSSCKGIPELARTGTCLSWWALAYLAESTLSRCSVPIVREGLGITTACGSWQPWSDVMCCIPMLSASSLASVIRTLVSLLPFPCA
jgi:hypothetical protein